MSKFILILFLLACSPLVMALDIDGRLHAGIADESIWGWITIAFYLLAVARCIVKSNVSKKFGGYYQFWLYLATFLLFLAVNKQLNLQSWLTEILKNSALKHGWYNDLKPVQIAIIAVIGLGMFIALIEFRLFIANTLRNYKIAWLGIILLCAFIMLQAASIHNVDVLINHQILGLKVGMLVEISAIILIILGTFSNKKQVNSLLADTVSIPNYVNIKKEGDIVKCPQCGTQPLSKSRDDRLFKCRSCGFIYTVRLINS